MDGPLHMLNAYCIEWYEGFKLPTTIAGLQAIQRENRGGKRLAE
jgi:hypothetical protein